MSGPIYNAVRHSQASTMAASQHSPTSSTYSDPKLQQLQYTKEDLRESTKHRKRFAIFTSIAFLIALVFLILVQIGNLSNMHVLGDLYFFKLDVSNIVVKGLPQNHPSGTAARQAGLHDFYQVGMWNFCEGYEDEGITACSKPMLMYWFNPIQILIDELMNGETITLPASVTNYLNIIRTASHAMFVFFFASTFTSFILVFLCPLAVYSRLTSIPIGFFALCSGLMTFLGTGISTGIWLVFKHQLNTYAPDMNIVPTVGLKMFIFMWIAAGFALIGGLGQAGMCCCGTSRRDIKTGRRVGRKARTEGSVAVEENPALRRRWWGSVSQ